ncbi:unnamed protein product [Citrullus colocynthis]|uniref:F-box domain-containing protein n=1 Tax=Citrullus colocynthis TaxID=252529 RepID=A0ABP0ZE97_9ROSI
MNWGMGLPLHFGEAIFSKLAVSNLPACRVVCKTWNAMILDYASSSKFLTNDFILSTCDNVPNCNLTNQCNPKMHCFRFDPTRHLDVDFDGFELEGNKSAPFGFDGDWSSITLTKSCNGLLFICKFNPMTNEFMQIPAFAFGFSPTTKQYKFELYCL